MEKEEKEISSRMSSKERFQLMLKQALTATILEDKPPLPKQPRANKALMLKKEHTA